MNCFKLYHSISRFFHSRLAGLSTLFVLTIMLLGSPAVSLGKESSKKETFTVASCVQGEVRDSSRDFPTLTEVERNKLKELYQERCLALFDLLSAENEEAVLDLLARGDDLDVEEIRILAGTQAENYITRMREYYTVTGELFQAQSSLTQAITPWAPENPKDVKWAGAFAKSCKAELDKAIDLALLAAALLDRFGDILENVGKFHEITMDSLKVFRSKGGDPQLDGVNQAILGIQMTGRLFLELGVNLHRNHQAILGYVPGSSCPSLVAP